MCGGPIATCAASFGVVNGLRQGCVCVISTLNSHWCDVYPSTRVQYVGVILP